MCVSCCKTSFPFIELGDASVVRLNWKSVAVRIVALALVLFLVSSFLRPWHCVAYFLPVALFTLPFLFLRVACASGKMHTKEATEEIDLNVVSLDFFQKEEIEEARQYLGRRYSLWLECQQGLKPKRLLDVHACLMRDAQDQAKGFLWKISLRGKKGYLYATSHIRFRVPNETFKYMVDFRGYKTSDEADQAYDTYLKSVYERAERCLHPCVFKAFTEAKKDFYLEVNEEDRVAYHEKLGTHAPSLNDSKETKHLKVLPFGSEWLLSCSAKYKYIGAKSLETPEKAFESFDLYNAALQEEPKYAALQNEVVLQNADVWQFNNWEEFEKMCRAKPPKILAALNGKDNERSINFKEQILKVLQTKNPYSPFFGIGAIHFYGENGLLALLKKEGADIEFIDLK